MSKIDTYALFTLEEYLRTGDEETLDKLFAYMDVKGLTAHEVDEMHRRVYAERTEEQAYEVHSV